MHGDNALAGAPSTGNSFADSTGTNAWQYSNVVGVGQNPPVAIQETPTPQQSFCAWTLNAAPATSVTMTQELMVFATMVIAEWSGVSSEDTGAAAGITAVGAGLSASITLSLSGTGELVLLGANCTSDWAGGPSQLTAFAGGGSPSVGYALNQSGSPAYTWSDADGASSDGATIAVAAFLPPAAPAAGAAYTAFTASM